MLLCPESEQFTPGKVFMILFRNKKITEFLRHRTANLRLPHILFQTILTTTFNKAILKTDVAQLQLSNIFPFTLWIPLFRERHGVRFSRDGNFSVSTAKIVSVAHIAATG